MALKPTDKQHEQQIAAGVEGRKKGHHFEKTLAEKLNGLKFSEYRPYRNNTHQFSGDPASSLLLYIANDRQITIKSAHAWWLGGLATSGEGDVFYDGNGQAVTKSKSDVLIRIAVHGHFETIGISVKTCNKKTPTNDQMYFTTAKAFCQLLRAHGIGVSSAAEIGLCQFCGDSGFRPLDLMERARLDMRVSDPARYYWEELSEQARLDWKKLFTKYQELITRLLFQKAYKADIMPPAYLLHQTVKYEKFSECSTAIFSIDEIVRLSKEHAGFELSPYTIHKGRYKADNSVHLAPRFGLIQFQRGGQKQHPTQLQFNLKAGYFKALP